MSHDFPGFHHELENRKGRPSNRLGVETEHDQALRADWHGFHASAKSLLLQVDQEQTSHGDLILIDLGLRRVELANRVVEARPRVELDGSTTNRPEEGQEAQVQERGVPRPISSW